MIEGWTINTDNYPVPDDRLDVLKDISIRSIKRRTGQTVVKSTRLPDNLTVFGWVVSWDFELENEH
jgi:hypothetical protein